MPYAQFETVLLAAGLSMRMRPSNKLLITVDKTPLIYHSARLYCDLGMKVSVIVGHEAQDIETALGDLPVKIILNTDYAAGQNTSIRAGLAAAPLQGEGLLMALGDQPLLESADISALCEAFLKTPRNSILVPWFDGKRGNPALLPIKIARQLRTKNMLPRAFMDANPQRVEHYDAPNAHFTTDLDTPEDVERFLSLQKHETAKQNPDKSEPFR